MCNYDDYFIGFDEDNNALYDDIPDCDCSLKTKKIDYNELNSVEFDECVDKTINEINKKVS